MHINENTALDSSEGSDVKEEGADEPTTSSSSASHSTTTATVSLTDVSSPHSSSTYSSDPSKNNTSAACSFVPLTLANASDSAVETDDSSQDEMLIAPEHIKLELEEVDSDCDDDVDKSVLQRLSKIDCKIEPDTSSNSSCSLGSFSNGFLNGESDASMRKRLFTSLSQSFPGSALSRVLHSMDTMPLDSDDEDLIMPDRLSSSCFGEIRLDKGEIEDDELTSLAWLQDSDLLKNINAGEDDLAPVSDEQKENADGQKNGEGGGGVFVTQTHPPHVPYNPHKHVNSKPPYSFSCLIFMAVEESPEKKLPVKDIYNWILTHFPYFQNAPTGWKNSVRHNLSLNKCFKKVEKDKGTSIGKGSLWCIDPDYRPNLLQALRKTPYHPYHQLQMMSTMQPQQQIHAQGVAASGFRPMPLAQRPVPNTVSPHLFPFLSRRLAQTGFEYFDREMQDVANTLVAMKGLNSKNSSGLSSDGSDASGPTSARSMLKRRQNGLTKRHGPIVVTAHPSEDHNYSAANVQEDDAASGTSSIDNEYDFGDEDDISEPSDYPSDWDCGSDGDEVDGDIPPAMQRKRLRIDLKKKEDKDEEEKQEGAKLLLSLAGFGNFSSDEEGRSPHKIPSSTSQKTLFSSSRSTRLSSSSKSQSSPKVSSSSTASKSSSSLSSSHSSTSRTPSRSSSRTPAAKSSSRTQSAASSKSSVTPASASKTSVGSSLSQKSCVNALSSSKSAVTGLSSSAKSVSAQSSSAPKSSASATTLKSSIIMTRRGKAAAEAAAAAAAPGVCTRGKKLSAS